MVITLSKKTIFLISLMFIILTVLAGCSAQNSTPASSTANSSSNLSAIAPSDAAKSSTETTNIDSIAKIGAQGAKNDQNLTLEKMLTYAIQDEYLAQAEYKYIIATFGDQKPFNNILKAEGTHISQLTSLFKRYNFSLPKNETDSYVPHPKNIQDSFKAGVQAEVDNIAMYENFMKQQLPDDVKTVFIQLRDASKNHLSAFQRGL